MTTTPAQKPEVRRILDASIVWLTLILSLPVAAIIGCFLKGDARSSFYWCAEIACCSLAVLVAVLAGMGTVQFTPRDSRQGLSVSDFLLRFVYGLCVVAGGVVVGYVWFAGGSVGATVAIAVLALGVCAYGVLLAVILRNRADRAGLPHVRAAATQLIILTAAYLPIHLGLDAAAESGRRGLQARCDGMIAQVNGLYDQRRTLLTEAEQLSNAEQERQVQLHERRLAAGDAEDAGFGFRRDKNYREYTTTVEKLQERDNAIVGQINGMTQEANRLRDEVQHFSAPAWAPWVKYGLEVVVCALFVVALVRYRRATTAAAPPAGAERPVPPSSRPILPQVITMRPLASA